MNKTVRILFFGDVVGAPGRAMIQKHAPRLQKEYAADFLIVNGENSASDGRGITPRIMKFFKHSGFSVVTSGNHIFAKRDIFSYLSEHKDLLRPINFPAGCPGSGVGVYTITDSVKIGVINVQGRVFMREHVGCPFKAVETALTYVQAHTKVIFVDVHAETTAEKIGFGIYFDGKVSAVIGTHTHVQTADERILPKGTAFITDAGMSGALNSMIGMQSSSVLHTMVTQMPAKFEVENTPPYFLCAVFIEVDCVTGTALSIQRVRIVDSDIAPCGTHEFADR